ncbi:MAG: hypothetical protein LKH74_03945 [Levilactobacillus sp.]|jgi:hypothetical protein|uniref:hypothetical protein n=1 Tax=Levilactobacillus sp. TaxID=2767919 RepID=UPI00258E1C40|nr:hypothetical protein [Levilactobacillus sp.]MCI1553054.1 hypothetical protein [Levilactobacillus sp.]MCI1598195.1 hypothetical protein [Levilactobacillus sp.]MCI1605058.1 hypothetical protein [Levilactobacillus sp.]
MKKRFLLVIMSLLLVMPLLVTPVSAQAAGSPKSVRGAWKHKNSIMRIYKGKKITYLNKGLNKFTDKVNWQNTSIGYSFTPVGASTPQYANKTKNGKLKVSLSTAFHPNAKPTYYTKISIKKFNHYKAIWH